MKKYLQNKLTNEKGMTLIELLAVIVIIAIIAAIAIPAIGNIIENSRYSAVKADGLNVIAAAQIYYTDNADKTTVSLKTLKDDGYLESSGKLGSTDTEDTEKVDKPDTGLLELTTGAIKFSGDKTVTFSSATVSGINANDKKGSEVTSETISD